MGRVNVSVSKVLPRCGHPRGSTQVRGLAGAGAPSGKSARARLASPWIGGVQDVLPSFAVLQPLVSSAFNAFKAFTMNCTATAASNSPMMRDRMFRAIGLRKRLL